MNFITLNIDGFAKNDDINVVKLRYNSFMNQTFTIKVYCNYNGKDRIQPDTIVGHQVSIKIEDNQNCR